ncbi:hypothetical protein UAW_03264 [Enterococcus haemoperoxidus ATCC BAA-382]|uniref:Uncharacterized protein n=1 Tax=Enterococcus haemoperoxidus ATCC BAA-382 TaxID=1158608 RepID=R2SW22_9ENTE|nr:hypothetical protein [Enterococcus haemoperoxidus]EOH92279.1 hypothetical protein UAW_03264 [Enterococcus haemoperoxidus ATCC BAA-382]EOT61964.1 hypothetical protein I583_00947 [Enterococcus haemoperoxidus ATCC BAA-382]OJG54126.1 hypothetical protein RV06_GL003079 [Enterococcus haemoperoxidus]
MNFQKIKDQLTESTPKSFLTAVLENDQDEESTIIFSQTIEEQFEQNVHYLASDDTISLDDLSNWSEQEFLVVAQTIDGDYIAGTTEQSFVIPVSLYKSDIETYDLFLSDFFIAHTNNLICSSILPKNE